jgi:hypothetical protein
LATRQNTCCFQQTQNLHFPRAASNKTFTLLGVCLQQPLTKQAIKTFTKHCACLSIICLFAEKPHTAKAQKSTDFTIFFIPTVWVYVKKNALVLANFIGIRNFFI